MLYKKTDKIFLNKKVCQLYAGAYWLQIASYY